MQSSSSKVNSVLQSIRSFPDFPKPGILFRDVFGVLSNPEASQALNDLLLEHCASHKGHVDAVCALESRGFLFGPQIALYLSVPFVPIRKRGKLPGEIQQVSFELEYGTDVFEMQRGVLREGAAVLVVDDLLATGGSLAAACRLVGSVGGTVRECLVVIELEGLQGRRNVPSSVHSLVQYP